MGNSGYPFSYLFASEPETLSLNHLDGDLFFFQIRDQIRNIQRRHDRRPRRIELAIASVRVPVCKISGRARRIENNDNVKTRVGSSGNQS